MQDTNIDARYIYKDLMEFLKKHSSETIDERIKNSIDLAIRLDPIPCHRNAYLESYPLINYKNDNGTQYTA